jgi:hypothetical protein
MCQISAAARAGVPGSRNVKPRSYAVQQPIDFDSTERLLSSGSGPSLMHDERGSTRARRRQPDLDRQHRDAAPELQAGAVISLERSIMIEPVSERFYHRPRTSSP